MQSSLKTIAVGACVSALTGALLAGPAAAAPVAVDVPTLVLSIQDKGSTLLPDTRTLGCEQYPSSTSGSHPRKDAACASLVKARGFFWNLPSTGAACPMIYAPVTATAKGTFRGMQLNYQIDYANACVAAAESDNIFSW